MSLKLLPLNGEMMTIHRASTLCGIPENTLRSRVSEGMTLQQAVDMPYKPKCSLYDYHGVPMTRKQIAEAAGISLVVMNGAMYQYSLTPAEAADYISARSKPVQYNGRDMTLYEFAHSKKRSCYSMYIRIFKNGMTPEEAIAATDVRNVSSRMSAARMICGEIFSSVAPDEVGFRQQSDQLYTFGSSIYRYEVRFTGGNCARLVAIFKHPERGEIVSAIWTYSVDKKGIRRTGRKNA